MNLMTPEILRWLKELIIKDQLIKFYKSKEWRTIRSYAKERDHNECQSCKRAGGFGLAEMVHHIVEVRRQPELALTLSNLECECNACHNKLHPEKLNKSINERSTNEERW